MSYLTNLVEDMLDNQRKIIIKATDESVDERVQAEEVLQDDLRDELMGEMGHLVTCYCPLDCQPNTENLEEWLQMYYRLEKK